jgi:hypothetical protein
MTLFKIFNRINKTTYILIISAFFSMHFTIGWSYENPYNWHKDSKGCKAYAVVPDEKMTWSGKCKNGFAEGYGTLVFPSGTRFEGNLNRGKMNGKGEYSENKFHYEGDYVNGFRSGKGILKNIIGTYEGDFANDWEAGKGILKYVDGNQYEGEFVKGLRTGKGVLKYTNGDQYEGNFLEGDLHGKGVYKWVNGYWIDGEFIHNNIATGKVYDKNGVFTAMNLNGKFVEVNSGEPTKTKVPVVSGESSESISNDSGALSNLLSSLVIFAIQNKQQRALDKQEKSSHSIHDQYATYLKKEENKHFYDQLESQRKDIEHAKKIVEMDQAFGLKADDPTNCAAKVDVRYRYISGDDSKKWEFIATSESLKCKRSNHSCDGDIYYRVHFSVGNNPLAFRDFSVSYKIKKGEYRAIESEQHYPDCCGRSVNIWKVEILTNSCQIQDD